MLQNSVTSSSENRERLAIIRLASFASAGIKLPIEAASKLCRPRSISSLRTKPEIRNAKIIKKSIDWLLVTYVLHLVIDSVSCSAERKLDG